MGSSFLDDEDGVTDFLKKEVKGRVFIKVEKNVYPHTYDEIFKVQDVHIPASKKPLNCEAAHMQCNIIAILALQVQTFKGHLKFSSK